MSSEAVEQARYAVRERMVCSEPGCATGEHGVSCPKCRRRLDEYAAAVREEAVRETAQRYEEVLTRAWESAQSMAGCNVCDELFDDDEETIPHALFCWVPMVRALLPDPSTEGK